jgi:hypothetical protein
MRILSFLVAAAVAAAAAAATAAALVVVCMSSVFDETRLLGTGPGKIGGVVLNGAPFGNVDKDCFLSDVIFYANFYIEMYIFF